MRQYELAIRIAQIHHLVDERKYKKALTVIQTLDMRQVRSLSDLKVFAEVFTRTEQYDAAKATYLRIYRKSRTRRVLHRLIYLSIRTNALDDAEAYYQEYVRMHPSQRDALILRYRIEKAKGVPIGELIEILQELKQEEYIEEWAYELAKLYHRAGRRDECKRECEDILLWFGSGEIVERAKILIEHLEEKDPMPYIDNKDFTTPKKEEPNPNDTGSLPDIKEFLKEQKELKKEEKRRERALRREERYAEDDYEDDYEEPLKEKEHSDTDEWGKKSVTEPDASEKAVDLSSDKKTDNVIEEMADKKATVPSKSNPNTKKQINGKNEVVKSKEVSEDTKKNKKAAEIKPHEKKEKGGIYKLSSSILKFVMKEEEDFLDYDEEAVTKDEKVSKKVEARPSKKEQPQQETTKKEVSKKREDHLSNSKTEPAAKAPSQSGTGITQDLAKEIAAIYEMEHREQLKEKAVAVLNEGQNLASDVLDRMTKAAQRSTQKEYIPLDVEEITDKNTESRQPAKDAGENGFGYDSNKSVKEAAAKKEEAEKSVTADEDTSTTESNEKESAVQQISMQEREENLTTQEIPVTESRENLTTQEIPVTESRENLTTQEIPVTESREDPAPQETIATAGKEEINTETDSVSDAYHSPLEGYEAPESHVIENEYIGIPEINTSDLPTTRALHRSFKDILKLISGELDPSHFVLMGQGEDKIVGVSKQIVRVLKESGFLSVGRIAKISSEQLNKMDLVQFQSQLKGNCLLINGAADLLFPTISKVFSIMEEYHGDFVVILADEGATLDQLFRFVPALAKKFKYIIDISEYTKEDYTF